MRIRILTGFRVMLVGISLLGLARAGAAQARVARPGAGVSEGARRLRVFFVDVEGGQATLFVTPEGKSLLIDTGWDDHEGRDADRIVAAANKAGLSRIDFVLITHFHVDHVGGLGQLVARIPVGTVIDHGVNRELDHGQVESDYSTYNKLVAGGKFRHVVLGPGDTVPVEGMKVDVLSGDGRVMDKPLAGAGEPNPYCKVSETRAADVTENARSLGVLVTFGKLKILDLGDLTWDKEMEMMCPVNRIGRVDVLVVSHHGWLQSSSPALVDAVHARVAVMDNGETKGGSLPTFETLAKAPGLEALWQIHASKEAGDLNRNAEYVANPLGDDKGYGLELIGRTNGVFDVENMRTEVSRRYGR